MKRALAMQSGMPPIMNSNMNSDKQIIQVNKETQLRLISIDDAKSIFETIDSQREYLGRWLPFVGYTDSIDDSIAFISSVLQTPADRAEQVFVIYQNDKFAGVVGFKDTDRLNRKTEIGYWLSQPFQKKGIITQSVQKLVEYAFNKLEMNRIQIRCAVGNEPSKRIPQRLNFKFEGVEREGELLLSGEFTNLEVYSLLKSDF